MIPQPKDFCPMNLTWAVSASNNCTSTVSKIWFASQIFYTSKNPALELGHGNLWLEERTMSNILGLPAGNQM